MSSKTKGAEANRNKDKTKGMTGDCAGDIPVLGQVSFITTVYNEEDSIIEFLQSLKDQTCLPEEIIIVDGGSTDRTFDIISGFFSNWAGESGSGEKIKLKTAKDIPGNDGEKEKGNKLITVKLLQEKGANISLGRNTAIRHACGKFISVSDAGCYLHPRWLEEINSSSDKSLKEIMGGINYARCNGFLQKCLALCIMPGLSEIRENDYMPSSRNISFKKKYWEEVGGYPRGLDYGEDMKFNFNLKENGYRLSFNPRAKVYWKMRKNPVEVFKQFFRYASGDALGRMYPVRHLIRFLTGLGFIAVIALAALFSSWIMLSFIFLFAAYSYKPYYRLFINWQGNEKCRPGAAYRFLAIFLIPVLLLYIDSAKAFGYLYGLAKKKMIFS